MSSFYNKCEVIDTGFTTPCWQWTAYIDKDGYAKVHINKKNYRAHRWIWEFERGPISKELEIDHLCRNRACQNTDHMELVTNLENTRRGNACYNRYKIECLRGHPYSGTNLYLELHSEGIKRRCKICRKAQQAKYNEKRKC